ncbi:hypothetical protein R3P38DRAFT_1054208 [Favolaschia claudopus]|uniref:Uncharacterized protein n=1 Tax=Favolaschia claudopus TaxID=2862362 RepID=A0AAW0BFH9_9AGAR
MQRKRFWQFKDSTSTKTMRQTASDLAARVINTAESAAASSKKILRARTVAGSEPELNLSRHAESGPEFVPYICAFPLRLIPHLARILQQTGLPSKWKRLVSESQTYSSLSTNYAHTLRPEVLCLVRLGNHNLSSPILVPRPPLSLVVREVRLRDPVQAIIADCRSPGHPAQVTVLVSRLCMRPLWDGSSQWTSWENFLWQH